MSEEKNEFEDLGEEEFAPEATNSDVPGGNDDMIASGSGGTEYDIDKAPDTIKAPPRINMDGQETVIKDVKIILPDSGRPWATSRNGNTKYKYCIFRLYYENGQQETVSGMRLFPREVNGVEKYSDPTIAKSGTNQATKLMKLYADYKKKDIQEISLREFLSYLRSGCKVKIKTEEVTNPSTNEKITKNLVGKFL